MSYEYTDALNWSSLKRIRYGRKCDVIAAMKFRDDRDTEAMKLGRAFHELMALGELKSFTIKTGCKTTSIPGHITEHEIAKVSIWAQALREGCQKHGITWDPDSHEKEIYWDFDGIPCKARLDAVDPNGGWIIDWKSADEPEPSSYGFKSKMTDYIGQLAWYSKGWFVRYKARYGGILGIVGKYRPNKVFFVRSGFGELMRFYDKLVHPLLQRYLNEDARTSWDMTAMSDGENGFLVGEGSPW